MMCIGPMICRTPAGQCCGLLIDGDNGRFICPVSCQALPVYINSGQTIPNNYSTTNITINVSDGDIVYISGGGCILIILYSVVLINYVIFEMYYNEINQKQKKTFYGFT